jgi:ATP-dependent Clp protease ATP-binding subunit ClpB
MDLSLHITQDAFDHIAEIGYDPFFGARPIKRVIQKQVLNELSKALLSGNIDRTKNIVMDVFDGKMVFRKPITALEEV